MSLKIKFLNTIRSVLTIETLDSIIASQIIQRPNYKLLKKVAPGNTLYRKGSHRVCNRNGINYSLDLSDYPDWLLYYSSDADSSAGVLTYLKQGDTVLDIGGNIGQTALRMAQKIGETGRVISFEPYPETTERFEYNLKLNDQIKNITLEGIALGEAKSILKMFQDCSTNSGGNRMLHPSAQNNGGIEEVMVTSLDEYVADKNHLKHINLIKIDVEGFEMKVLKGAKKVLRDHKPDLFIELDDENLKKQGNSAVEVVDFLIGLKYQVMDSYDNKIINVKEMKNHTDIYCSVKPDF
jgi:FkbM family methyltransferase